MSAHLLLSISEIRIVLFVIFRVKKCLMIPKITTTNKYPGGRMDDEWIPKTFHKTIQYYEPTFEGRSAASSGPRSGKIVVWTLKFYTGINGAHLLGCLPLWGERGGHPRTSEKFEASDRVLLRQQLSEMNSGYHRIVFWQKKKRGPEK